jgi:hypothetical protein
MAIEGSPDQGIGSLASRDGRREVDPHPTCRIAGSEGDCRFWIFDFGFWIGPRISSVSIQNPKSKIENGSRAVDSEITYFVTYPCPHCKVELEAQHGGWQGWLRCPECGVPSLPPEFLLGHPLTRRRVPDSDEDQSALVIDEAPEGPGGSDRTPRAGSSSPVSALRLIFMTGLILSLFLLLIAYMDQNTQTTAIFGFLSIAFFLLFVRTPARNRAVRGE